MKKYVLKYILSVLFLFIVSMLPIFGEAETSAQLLYKYGFIAGDNGNLMEEQNLTRAQACVLLSEMYGSKNKASKHAFSNDFFDVYSNDWFAPYVVFARASGWVSGYPDGSFKPNNPVSKQEWSAMLMNALGYSYSWNNVVSDMNGIGIDFLASNNSTLKRKEAFDGMWRALLTPANGEKQALGIKLNKLSHDIIELDNDNIELDKKTSVEKNEYIIIKDVKITLGDSLQMLESILGKPNRIDPCIYNLEWFVYNNDYTRFIMFGVNDDKVVAIYTNSKGFEGNGFRYGDVKVESQNSDIKFYFDKHQNLQLHAVLILDKDLYKDSLKLNENFFRAQELQNFDATNAFRVNNSLNALQPDYLADLTAKNHSQDMADKNYFSHTGLDGTSPWDRYKNNNGKNFGSGENLSAGRLLGIDSFDGWVNSEGHRKNMLGSHNFLGVGYGYNIESHYKYYMTQFFTR